MTIEEEPEVSSQILAGDHLPQPPYDLAFVADQMNLQVQVFVRRQQAALDASLLATAELGLAIDQIVVEQDRPDIK